MSRVVNILMSRDGLTEKQATELVEDTAAMMAACNYDPDECEDIMLDELGLEMDYIYDVI